MGALKIIQSIGFFGESQISLVHECVQRLTRHKISERLRERGCYEV